MRDKRFTIVLSLLTTRLLYYTTEGTILLFIHALNYSSNKIINLLSDVKDLTFSMQGCELDDREQRPYPVDVLMQSAEMELPLLWWANRRHIGRVRTLCFSLRLNTCCVWCILRCRSCSSLFHLKPWQIIVPLSRLFVTRVSPAAWVLFLFLVDSVLWICLLNFQAVDDWVKLHNFTNKKVLMKYLWFLGNELQETQPFQQMFKIVVINVQTKYHQIQPLISSALKMSYINLEL